MGQTEFIGDEPYTEPTPRQVNTFKELPLDDEVIRLRSASVREAIRAYIPPEKFNEWFTYYIAFLDRPAHYETIWEALDNVPGQFNLRPPEKVAANDVLRKYLNKGPNLARFVLSFAENQVQARHYPELVLALAMYQGAHKCYLQRVLGHLNMARFNGRITEEQWFNADAVINGPFKQFDDFVIHGTLLPLIFLKYSEFANSEHTDEEVMLQAITAAWDVFIDKKILRRDFGDGLRMICPANQHLRAAKDNQIIERIYHYVCANKNSIPIQRLLMHAERMARYGAFYKVGNYIRGLTEAVDRNKNARGGKGLMV